MSEDHTPKNEISGSDSRQQARRRLIKALAGAGGIFAAGKTLPENWTQPVVDSVMLPAHAQATGVNRNYAGPVSAAAASGPGPAPSFKVLEVLIPAAHAGGGNAVATGTICVQVNGSAYEVQVGLNASNDCGIFSGNGKVAGGYIDLAPALQANFSNVKVKINSQH
jgi:hypothetical protein